MTHPVSIVRCGGIAPIVGWFGKAKKNPAVNVNPFLFFCFECQLHDRHGVNHFNKYEAQVPIIDAYMKRVRPSYMITRLFYNTQPTPMDALFHKANSYANRKEACVVVVLHAIHSKLKWVAYYCHRQSFFFQVSPFIVWQKTFCIYHIGAVLINNEPQ